MQVILHTHSSSWAESARLALLAEGIEAVILDQVSPGTLGLQGSIRVGVGDEDAARAEAIMRRLEPPKAPPLPSWRYHKWALLSMGSGIVVAGMSSRLDEALVRRISGGLAAGLFVAALTLLFRGYRADAEHARLHPKHDTDD